MNKSKVELLVAELYALVAMVRCDLEDEEAVLDYLADMDSSIEDIMEELEK